MRNFRFDPKKFGGVILLIESKLTPPNGHAAHKMRRAEVTQMSAGTCWYALPCALHCLLQPLILHSATSSSCCTFASPWRNIFVQIHGGTTLLKAKFGTTSQKRPKNHLNWGVGSSYGTNKTPLPNPSFHYEVP